MSKKINFLLSCQPRLGIDFDWKTSHKNNNRLGRRRGQGELKIATQINEDSTAGTYCSLILSTAPSSRSVDKRGSAILVDFRIVAALKVQGGDCVVAGAADGGHGRARRKGACHCLSLPPSLWPTRSGELKDT